MTTHRSIGSAELVHARWTKSSYSGTGGGNCVEVADLATGHRAVRDSKNPDRGELIFTSTEWAAFAAGVRAGEFD
ncbi:MAG: DUF397 domain-containing protein [Pseudonocardiaceae bacterium]